MSVYFAYRSTRLYRSDSIIIGVYTTPQEAIRRIEDQGGLEKHVYPTFTYWKDDEYKYSIKKFPMGDCPTNLAKAITSRGIPCNIESI